MSKDGISKAKQEIISSPKNARFYGIRFVEPLTNEDRWQPLKPAQHLDRASDSYGYIAPQLPAQNDLLMANSENLKQHEDCLNLNIYSADVTARLPVMVWIHGGGFTIGSGSLPAYHGSELAKNQNVVVVSINYRLGSLGFLRLCDITNGGICSTGNEGLFDQISALKWIKRYIHHFGGDNSNITLFGESAGAMSIACLLAMPQSKGLFHKAILQSGAGHSYHTKQQANELGQYFINTAKQLGYEIEQLKQLTTTQLLAIQQQVLSTPGVYKKFGILPFKPVIDGLHLPLPPHQAIAQGCAKDITIIAGTNDDEWTLFAQLLKQKIDSPEQLKKGLGNLLSAEQIAQCIPLMSQQLDKRKRRLTAQNLLNEALTNYWFHQPCHRLLTAQLAAGGIAYGYKFGRKTSIEALGSTHITEIGFVFANIDTSLHGQEARVMALSNEIQQYWGCFAHDKRTSMQPPTALSPALADMHTCSLNSSCTTPPLDWPPYQDQLLNKNNSNTEYFYLYFGHDHTNIGMLAKAEVEFWAQLIDQQLASF